MKAHPALFGEGLGAKKGGTIIPIYNAHTYNIQKPAAIMGSVATKLPRLALYTFIILELLRSFFIPYVLSTI